MNVISMEIEKTNASVTKYSSKRCRFPLNYKLETKNAKNLS